jgi:hypothetical protein
MRINRDIPNSTGYTSALYIRQMMIILTNIPFGEPKINEINLLRLAIHADTKILRLNIPMQVAFQMHILKSFNQLFHQHESSFDGKGPPTLLEQLLKVGTQQIHD